MILSKRAIEANAEICVYRVRFYTPFLCDVTLRSYVEYFSAIQLCYLVPPASTLEYPFLIKSNRNTIKVNIFDFLNCFVKLD